MSVQCAYSVEREVFSSRAHARSHVHSKNNGEREQLSIRIPQFDVSLDDSIFALNHQTNRFSSQFPFVTGFKSDVEKIGFFSQNFLSRNLLLAKFSTSREIFFSQSLLRKFLLSCKVVSLLYVRRVVGGGGTGSAVLDVFVVTQSTSEGVRTAQGTILFFWGIFFFQKFITVSK